MSTKTHTYKVRPDSKGRISLGRVAEGVSSYEVSQGKNGRIILDPCVEIPAREKWLFDDPIALKQVKQGLKDAAAGKVKQLGSFAKYIDDESE